MTTDKLGLAWPQWPHAGFALNPPRLQTKILEQANSHLSHLNPELFTGSILGSCSLDPQHGLFASVNWAATIVDLFQEDYPSLLWADLLLLTVQTSNAGPSLPGKEASIASNNINRTALVVLCCRLKQ